jgi:hypothetical protein
MAFALRFAPESVPRRTGPKRTPIVILIEAMAHDLFEK